MLFQGEGEELEETIVVLIGAAQWQFYAPRNDISFTGAAQWLVYAGLRTNTINGSRSFLLEPK